MTRRMLECNTQNGHGFDLPVLEPMSAMHWTRWLAVCTILNRIPVGAGNGFSVVFTCWPTSPLRKTMHIKTRVLRDIKRRKAVQVTEVIRRAYLYVARNQTLPPQVRHQAQLQLNTFAKDSRPTAVKNRCTVTGRGRGVMSEFGLCRVSPCSFSTIYFPNWWVA